MTVKDSGLPSHADELRRLNDQTIRAALVLRLKALPVKPRAILQELRVHNGNAIADVVTIGRFAHCYEIKGETDSIQRLARQGAFYDLTFMKTTVVTTAARLSRAIEIVPPHWGVMQASLVAGRIAISYIRHAKRSPDYDKRLALLTLWRSELLEMAVAIDPKARQLNRDELSKLISANLAKATLAETIGVKLIDRSKAGQTSAPYM